MSVDRRELFRFIGAGVVAGPCASAGQHVHGGAAAPTAALSSYTPRALTQAQYDTLGGMLDVLLPADEESPGAREAGVARYIDTTLHYADEATRRAWVTGFGALSREVGDRELTAGLTRIAEAELQPRTEGERFFVTFKQAAIQAYYLSAAGRRSLGYKGDTAIREFPGCTHPGHHAGDFGANGR